ncbi:MAG: AtpZ/AtpI family protein [Candidatus Zixiibacteriota bacterium]|nr:MAG: AtpZ/AtpI family protein [candidate division Zixibacteria bacterium]
MCPLLDPRKKKQDKSFAQISLLAAVPAILIAAPALGFLAGSWADRKFGTDPYLLIAGLVIGFAAAGREIASLVKKAQALNEKKDAEENGT